MSPVGTIFGVILAILAGAFVLAAVIFLFGTIFSLTLKILKNIFTFIGATVTDTLRFVGAVLAALIFAPLVVLSIVVGRWSRSKHMAGAFSLECHSAFRCTYRVFIGNPARLLGLSKALEGVEQRVPDAMAAAPTSDKPNKKRVGVFDGYTIVGSLKGGGSGGKLYIAEPNETKQAVFAKRSIDVGQVVIKVFSLHDGSSMPQIVRESRALDAARKLGLVLEHELTKDRFFYVMRYVPGESLSAVTKRMHSLSPREGLDDAQLKHTIGYADDLLTILDTYHRSGLWHKDVKPDNIIIDGKHGDAKAHLVDFGLVTPLRSAMTLTTHGTEYFRDPELVRQALRGVKVHQIDGSKFDVYAAGAVLYSMVENSFPAHSGLSQITKRCPDALRWIVRRAMAEYDRRYPSSAAMLADLRVVMLASDPFTVKPADLPSVKLGDNIEPEPIPEPMPMYGAAPFQRVGSPVPPQPPQSPEPVNDGRRVARPKVNLVGWWSGKYAVVGKPQAQHAEHAEHAPRAKKNKGFVADDAPSFDPRIVPVEQRKSAKDQVRDARKRAHAMRGRASTRRKTGAYKNSPGAGVIFAGLLGMAVMLGGVIVVGALLTAESIFGTPNTPMPPMFPSTPDQVVAPEVLTPGVLTQEILANLPRVDAEVLLVLQYTGSMDQDTRDALVQGVSIFNAQGMDTFGDLTDPPTQTDIDSLADYRNAIGANPSDSDAFIIRSRQWVADNPAMDAVMVLSADPETSEQYLILVGENFHTIQPLNESVVPTVLGLLAKNGLAAIPD